MSNGLILDFVIIGLTLIIGIGGILSGLIKEGFGLAGILIGVYVSTSKSKVAGDLINQYVYKTDNEFLLNLLGFISVLVIVWSVFIILGRIISKLASLSGLGMFDKIMGFIFCSGKIFIVFSIIASCINAMPFLNAKTEKIFSDSKVYPVLISLGNSIANIEIVQNAIKSKQIDINEESKKQLIMKEGE